MNFNGLGNDQPNEGNYSGNFPLARQSSVFSLTFDEFQTNLGKDYGSVNMDELLKSIWSAEETQNPASVAPGGENHLQRQGSITLPRTMSQKTVDEVWKDMAKEFEFCTTVGVSPAQRQQTLGEMTLEEFLYKAGVVSEEAVVKPKPGGFWGDLAQANTSSSGFGISFQQPSVHQNPQISLESSNLPLNVNGKRPSQTHQQPMIYPKKASVSYAPSMVIPSSTKFMVDPMGNNGLKGGLGSPGSLSSDGLNSNGDTASVSPVPYMFTGAHRGRRSNNTVEKVIERRHRRMIKNRESAARSRARKQVNYNFVFINVSCRLVMEKNLI